MAYTPPTEVLGPATMARRASSAGLGTTGGSLGRSSSIITRGVLQKKDTAKEAERAREKDRRAREKEDKARAKDSKDANKPQRPKLSLATSSAQRVPQPSTSQVRSPTRQETGRAIMRRVKSGSSLNAAIVLEERRPASPTRDAPQTAKRKRNDLVHRIVRGLDSAMDFVDGK